MASILHLLPSLIALWSIILCISKQSAAVIRLTNVRCQTYNETLTTFDYCYLKAVDRNTKEIYVKVNFYDKPAKSAALKLQFLKKSNGYIPFMPDIKIDACQYLAKRNNIVINSLYRMWFKYTNMNHTCPYNHDLIIDKIKLDPSNLNWIPYPSGEYAFYTIWWINGVRHFQIDFFFTFMEN